MIDNEPKIYLNHSSSKADIFFFKEGTMGIFSCPKPGEERVNQDSCALLPIGKHKALLLVADGIGGHRGGDQASRLSIETFVELIKTFDESKSSTREFILNCFEEANKKVRELGIGAGTTLVVAEVNKTYVRFYSTGDSTAQLFGGKGVLKYKNLEQSASALAFESGLMSFEEAHNHEEANVLIHAIGDELLNIQISNAIATSSRDLILLASDGLTANLDQETIISCITNGSIEERMNRLVELAKNKMIKVDQGGHPDDLSIILHSLGRNDNKE